VHPLDIKVFNLWCLYIQHCIMKLIINAYPANVDNRGAPNNARKFHIRFSSAFKGLLYAFINKQLIS